MSELFMRLLSGPMVADKFADDASPFLPVQTPMSAVFVRDTRYQDPLGTAALSSTVRWEIIKSGHYLERVDLCFTLAPMTPNAGAGTVVQYQDYIGLAAVRQIRVGYGQRHIQILERDELFCHAMKYMSADQLVHWQKLVVGGLSDSDRQALCTVAQYVRVPLTLLWNNQIESNSTLISALAGKIWVEVDFDSSDNLIQQYVPGTPNTPNTGLPATVGGIASPNWNEQTFFSSSANYRCQLRLVYVHVTSSEAYRLEQLYSAQGGVRYLINEKQAHTQEVIPSTFDLGTSSSYSFLVQNINQPMYAIFALLRWQGDLLSTYKTTPALNNRCGRDYFNVSGWLQPTGTSLPLTPPFNRFRILVGNDRLSEQGPIVENTDGMDLRFWKNGATAAQGILSDVFSHDPTAPAATYGCIDAGSISQMRAYLDVNPDCKAVGGYNTLGDVATQDIKHSSALTVTLFALTYNNVDIQRNDAKRTFN